MSKIILALALPAVAAAALYTNDTKVQGELFASFKRDFNKTYTSVEAEAHALEAFVEFLGLVDARNARDTGATHGITKFADLTQAEFEAKFLTLKEVPKLPNAHKLGGLRPASTDGLVDWTGKYTTAVKNQGYCGSCWAHSVAEQLESDSMRQLSTDYTLSPQQLTSCDTDDSGCDGGWPTNAYEWIEANGGLVTESDYPYTSGEGDTGTCDSSASSSPVITVSKYYQLSSESDMGAHVASTGPLAIALDASDFNSYTGGIISTCGTDIDHAVQIVGVDTSSYWKVRNSWGADWGEDGYIRLAYGSDMCGLTTIATYVDTATA